MKVLVIGGTGHVGTYMVPRLVALGHEVVVMSRGTREPYQPHAAWASVTRIEIDREAEDATGTFAGKVRDLNADAVLDMVCFDLESAKQMVEALRGHIDHYVFTGSVWIHGHGVEVPTIEDQLRQPIGEYGIQKDAIDRYLASETKRTGFPAASLHPGHISGPGWVPVNPQGNFNPDVFTTLARGEELTVPNMGLETVHHVHADDVAQAFIKTLERWNLANGQGFNIMAEKAITIRGFAEAMARWFGTEANLKYLPMDEWVESMDDEYDIEKTISHVGRSPNCSIDKAKTLLGYQPRYSPLQAVQEAVTWLIQEGIVKTS